tara:strand:- start:1641 stop:2303 length:663 start_codon:yes stop_codon:yes gene_type:complete
MSPEPMAQIRVSGPVAMSSRQRMQVPIPARCFDPEGEFAMSIKKALRNSVLAVLTAGSALGVAAPAVASPVVSSPNNCAVLVLNRGEEFSLFMTVVPGISGSYQLTLETVTPGTNSVATNMSGAFTAVPGQQTFIARTSFNTLYITDPGQPINGNPNGPRRTMSSFNDGRYGVDVHVNIDFLVYDEAGREVCHFVSNDASTARRPVGGLSGAVASGPRRF